jgi:hypothetical protein
MKRDELLNKKQSETTEYELTTQEKNQLAALLTLVQQAQQAQDIIYSNLLESVAGRLELSNKTLEFNMNEILEQGAKVAKLIAKDA